MKVLLLAPPYVPSFMRNARWDAITVSGSNWYPIYLAYCAGLLEKHGHEVKLLDAQVDGISREKLYKIIEDFNPELTVMYFSIVSLDNDLQIAEYIQEQLKRDIVLVGYSASINPIETLCRSKVKMLAEGEFDFTILDLANSKRMDQIDGLYWKDSINELHVNSPRRPVTAKELDDFPFVSDVYRRHLNIRNYYQPMHYFPFIDLFTGRGCIWGLCTFCVWPNTINEGAKYRTRDIENVIDELRFIKREMPYIKDVYFQDDTLPNYRAREISNAILDAKLKIRWSCYSRANLDLDILKLMKKAGCHLVEVGFESASDEILKNIRKGITRKQMDEFVENARKANLNIVGAFIIGLPGETTETIQETTEWVKKMPILRNTITMLKPFPSTPVYSWLKERGYLLDGKPNYPHLSSDELSECTKRSLRKVYFSKEYFSRILFKPREWVWIIKSSKYLIPYLLKKSQSI
jgi:radical SAM superfamily enzyme YgiQ (UPF0313 family)